MFFFAFVAGLVFRVSKPVHSSRHVLTYLLLVIFLFGGGGGGCGCCVRRMRELCLTKLLTRFAGLGYCIKGRLC